MADVNDAIDANRQAVRDLIASAERCRGNWTVPRAAGKWSPSQLVEHVARTLDESANLMCGAPTKFPTLPFFVRPLVRTFLFNRVLKTSAFPKARTNRAMNPESGPATLEDARARLEGALARFERECRARSEQGATVSSATFGSVTIADYVKFIALHTRHHWKQMQ